MTHLIVEMVVDTSDTNVPLGQGECEGRGVLCGACPREGALHLPGDDDKDDYIRFMTQCLRFTFQTSKEEKKEKKTVKKASKLSRLVRKQKW